MTDLEQVRAVLTTNPKSIPQITHELQYRGQTMNAEAVDAALLELHKQGQAQYAAGEGLIGPAWSLPRRKA